MCCCGTLCKRLKSVQLQCDHSLALLAALLSSYDSFRALCVIPCCQRLLSLTVLPRLAAALAAQQALECDACVLVQTFAKGGENDVRAVACGFHTPSGYDGAKQELETLLQGCDSLVYTGAGR